MFKEFKAFIMRGNVLDLAIAVIIGGAFGKIVTSFVNDIIMPPIGLLLGKVDFSNLFLNLSGTPYLSVADAKKAGIPTVNYGMFLNTLIDFLIVAIVIFFVVRFANKLQFAKSAPAPATSKDCPYCFSAISMKATRCPHCTSELKAI